MLILPLPNRPDWSRPPVATLGLILLCVFVFVVLQGTDHARWRDAVSAYQQSSLPALELRAYLAELEQREPDKVARLPRRLSTADLIGLLPVMEADRDFMVRLRAGEVITPQMPEYTRWREDRDRYEKLRARIFTEQYSLNASDPTPVTLVTHMFLHGGLMHLAGNMVVLFVVGYTVEASIGALGFLLLFVLGGVGACVPELIVPSRNYGLSLGASGAISAVMAGYLVLFGMRRIRFFYWFLFFFNTVRWPALVILPVWITNELLQKFVFDRDGNIGYLAHFGGFVTGAILIGLYRWRRGGRTSENVQRLDAESNAAELRERAAEQVAQMHFDRAALLFRDAVRALPQDDRALAEYLRVAALARTTGLSGDAAGRVLRRASQPDNGLEARVIGHALRELRETGHKSPPLSLAAWGRVCERLIDAGEFDDAEALVLRIVSRDAEGKVAPRLLQRLANMLARNGQAERAERARRMLAQRFPATAVT